jgi:hypothetical protein
MLGHDLDVGHHRIRVTEDGGVEALREDPAGRRGHEPALVDVTDLVPLDGLDGAVEREAGSDGGGIGHDVSPYVAAHAMRLSVRVR